MQSVTNKERLVLGSGPRGFTEKPQGRIHAGIISEAAVCDPLPKLLLAEVIDGARDHGLKRYTVEWIVAV